MHVLKFKGQLPKKYYNKEQTTINKLLTSEKWGTKLLVNPRPLDKEISFLIRQGTCSCMHACICEWILSHNISSVLRQLLMKLFINFVNHECFLLAPTS